MTTDLLLFIVEQAHPRSEYSIITFQHKVHSSAHKSGLLWLAHSILFCVIVWLVGSCFFRLGFFFFPRLKQPKISLFLYISKWYPKEVNQNDIVKLLVTAESSAEGRENSYCLVRCRAWQVPLLLMGDAAAGLLSGMSWFNFCLSYFVHLLKNSSLRAVTLKDNNSGCMQPPGNSLQPHKTKTCSDCSVLFWLKLSKLWPTLIYCDGTCHSYLFESCWLILSLF